jgi:Ca-activated chloride channel family protein
VVLVLDATSDVYTEIGEPGRGDRPRPVPTDRSILDKVLGPPPQPPPIRVDPLADLAFTRTVASAVIDRLGPNDRIAVIQAGRKVELLQDWTGDREAARHAVNWRFKLGDGTAVWDGVYLAAEELLSKVDGQRVVLVASDCVDTASRLTSADAAAALEKRGATAYVASSAQAAIAAAEKYVRDEGRILAPRRRQAARAIDALRGAESVARSFVERTGGAYFELRTERDAAAVASSVLDDLRAAYVLSYVPSDERRDGEWRAIAVFLDRPGLTVRTRRGYFAVRPR